MEKEIASEKYTQYDMYQYYIPHDNSRLRKTANTKQPDKPTYYSTVKDNLWTIIHNDITYGTKRFDYNKKTMQRRWHHFLSQDLGERFINIGKKVQFKKTTHEMEEQIGETEFNTLLEQAGEVAYMHKKRTVIPIKRNKKRNTYHVTPCNNTPNAMHLEVDQVYDHDGNEVMMVCEIEFHHKQHVNYWHLDHKQGHYFPIGAHKMSRLITRHSDLIEQFKLLLE